MTLHPLEKHVDNTIRGLGLLRRDAPVIVALSGGADSVALLSALVSLGYDCIAAHCNFHLRGEESLRDMRHAEQIAANLGVNIYIRDFNVAERIAKTGESVEMACRELRYDWFHQLLDRDFSQAIAVGHHREDNVETFFINLLRSSGIAGLTGMDFKRGFVVRPLLDLSRQQLEQYLADKSLDFVVDSTNAQNDFRRNRLRNIVLPSLETNFPGASSAILAVMDHLRDTRSIVDSMIKSVRQQFELSPDSLDVAAITHAYDNTTATALLYELLGPRGLNATQVADIARAVRAGSSGLKFIASSTRQIAELDRGILSFARRETDSSTSLPLTLKHDILNPIHIRVTPHHITQFAPRRDPDVIYLDMKVLDGNPSFELRHPRTADRIKPYGMTGEKLVSDILKDAKLSARQKRETWLLTRNDRVLWIVGLRASALFSITPKTQRFLKLRFIP